MNKLLVTTAIAAAITGGALSGASPASAANGINGNVSCVQGNSVTKPVGVWIDYDSKKGTWATIWSNGPKATFAQIAYSAPVAVKTFHLHIGAVAVPRNGAPPFTSIRHLEISDRFARTGERRDNQ